MTESIRLIAARIDKHSDLCYIAQETRTLKITEHFISYKVTSSSFMTDRRLLSPSPMTNNRI